MCTNIGRDGRGVDNLGRDGRGVEIEVGMVKV